MTKRKRRWLIGITTGLVLTFAALLIVARMMVARSEPYIREQAILYLNKRFDCDVKLEALRVSMPNFSAFRALKTRGRGLIAHVEGDGIAMSMRGRQDIPPLFTMKKFSFDIDIGTLLDTPKTVPQVTLDGLEINIPPKGQRPDIGSEDDDSNDSEDTGVVIEEVIINDAVLNLLPRKNPEKRPPLRFDLHRVQLNTVGKNTAMRYDASLTNAKPPGEILSQGNFGPWMTREPGDTPLNGQYVFDKADLGVFDGIAGILNSKGSFEGTLDTVNVRGEAVVPDFRLDISGNRVPLKTRFEVLVDGTNGNTILKPVNARLGSTEFTTSGAVIKEHGLEHRTIHLDVKMPKGNLQDLLRLSMKGPPFMEGRVSLNTKIEIPPLSGKTREKLRLSGRFQLDDSRFLRSNIQDKIDTLSRRGQGQPKNQGIDEVVAGMKGEFDLENQTITFRSLQFAVPGAAIDIAGSYQFDGPIDFHGTMQLQAKVSQTMTGWKRWILKPVDPFFSKNGAGTFLRIKVEGTADDPQFGLDRGKKGSTHDSQGVK